MIPATVYIIINRKLLTIRQCENTKNENWLKGRFLGISSLFIVYFLLETKTDGLQNVWNKKICTSQHGHWLKNRIYECRGRKTSTILIYKQRRKTTSKTSRCIMTSTSFAHTFANTCSIQIAIVTTEGMISTNGLHAAYQKTFKYKKMWKKWK